MRKLFLILFFVAWLFFSVESYEKYRAENSETKKKDSKPEESRCEGLPDYMEPELKKVLKLMGDTESAFERADMLKRRANHLYKIGQITKSEYKKAKEYRSLAGEQRARAYIYAQKLQDCTYERAERGKGKPNK